LVVASANTYDAAYRTEEGQGTLFVTGYKHEAQTGERSVMGETDDLVTRGVAHPTLVCKRQVLARDGRTFVCCVRDSAIAWNAYVGKARCCCSAAAASTATAPVCWCCCSY